MPVICTWCCVFPACYSISAEPPYWRWVSPGVPLHTLHSLKYIYLLKCILNSSHYKFILLVLFYWKKSGTFSTDTNNPRANDKELSGKIYIIVTEFGIYLYWKCWCWFLGWLVDTTGTYTATFFLSGFALISSALLLCTITVVRHCQRIQRNSLSKVPTPETCEAKQAEFYTAKIL